VLEADPNVVQKARDHIKEHNDRQDGFQESSDDSHSHDHADFGTKYNVTKSQASHSIKDINCMTFGAQSSRFWVLRKHINCMPKED
jgi:hypothetical protein